MTTRLVLFARCHHLRTLPVYGRFAQGLRRMQFSVSGIMRVVWELSLVQNCRGSVCRGAVDATCKWFTCLQSKSISHPSIRQSADYVSHSFAKTGFTFMFYRFPWHRDQLHILGYRNPPHQQKPTYTSF